MTQGPNGFLCEVRKFGGQITSISASQIGEGVFQAHLYLIDDPFARFGQ